MVTMTLTNPTDLQQAERGWMARDRVRRVTGQGLLDTGASGLILPADMVQRLGLRARGTRRVRYADGRIANVPWVSGVRIEVQGREATTDAMVHAAGTTPLIGKSTMDALGLSWEAASSTPTVMRSNHAAVHADAQSSARSEVAGEVRSVVAARGRGARATVRATTSAGTKGQAGRR